MRFSTPVVPWALISWLLTAVSGLTLVRLGCGMREPVITTSSTVAGWSADLDWAKAGETATVASVTPPIIVDVSRYVRVDCFSNSFFLRTEEGALICSADPLPCPRRD